MPAGNAALPFVIPSEVEGSAVLPPGKAAAFLKQNCHPDRSAAEWSDCLSPSSTNRCQLETPPSPLSSRAKSRDLQFSLLEKLRPFSNKIVIPTGAQRSGGTCCLR